jgi:Na+-transporting NADH:ubiquinone oxidoreductase subunit A
MDLQTGLNALTKLTSGLVFLGLPDACQSSELRAVQGVEIRTFKGPHPAGWSVFQINHIAPINKEKSYGPSICSTCSSSRLFNQGRVELSRQLL